MLKKLLAVDDEPNNLQVLRQILRDRYQLIFAPTGEKALEAAAKHLPDLILLDIMMPEMNGYEVCKRLKANPATKAIPVIFVTAMSEVEDEARGFDVGAVDYIQKPVSAPIMLRRVETHLSLVRVQELEDSHRQAVFMLGEAGHYNDNDTGAHIWRMAAYARVLAEAAGWPDHLVARLELAAPMHDTGKIGTPDSILQAPRKLTAAMGDHAGAYRHRLPHPEQFHLQDLRAGRRDRPLSPREMGRHRLPARPVGRGDSRVSPRRRPGRCVRRPDDQTPL